MIDWEDVAMVVGYSLLGLVIVGGIGAIIALQIAYIVG
jgi:preprotein translocase subunit Sss1